MHPTRHVFLSVVVLAFLAVSQVALAQVPLQFVTVPPCRVVDTRLAIGPFGGPSLQGQTSRDFAIPNGACSIPSTAEAYSLNVTVVPRPTLGYLTVWPTGQTAADDIDPEFSRWAGQGQCRHRAGGHPNQSISVFATDNTDVILDIDGYFVPANNTTLAFFPLTPCRVADTRWPTGTFGGPSLVSGQERIFPLLSSSLRDTQQRTRLFAEFHRRSPAHAGVPDGMADGTIAAHGLDPERYDRSGHRQRRHRARGNQPGHQRVSQRQHRLDY